MSLFHRIGREARAEYRALTRQARRPPGNRRMGEGNGRSSMTREQVCEMRRLVREEGLTDTEAYRRVKPPVRLAAASRAIRGESWSHVTEEPPVWG